MDYLKLSWVNWNEALKLKYQNVLSSPQSVGGSEYELSLIFNLPFASKYQTGLSQDWIRRYAVQ